MIVKPTKTVAASKSMTITFDQDIESETVTLTSDLATSNATKSGKVITFDVDAGEGVDRTEYVIKGVVNDETQYTYIVVLNEELENAYYYGAVHLADVFYNTLPDSRATTWNTATAVAKRKALIEATKSIDRLRFKGAKSVSTQPLEFPRAELVVPTQIEQASYYLAGSYLPEHNADEDYSVVGVIQEKFHAVMREYKETGRDLTHIASGIPSIEAWRLLKPFLRSSRQIKFTRI